jgi:hypothetical protein
MKTFYLIVLSIILFSCQEEKSTEQLKKELELIASKLKTDKLQLFNFKLKNDTVITGKEGTRIFITKDLFENYANGKITLELKEFYKKEDIILNGLTTVTNKDELLESSGMFFINFNEDGKQLKIKKGKKFSVESSDKILKNSTIYFNPSDSIFKWEKTNNNLYITVEDYQRNRAYGIVGNGFAKEIRLDSLEFYKKASELDEINNNDCFQCDTIANYKLSIEEEKFYNIENQLARFTSENLGWINIDKVLNYEIKKEITFKNTNNDIQYLSLNLIYLDNKTIINEYLDPINGSSISVKISGKIKVVVYGNLDNKIMYDSFYIDKNTKSEFEINFKETTIEKLKQELISK